MTSKLTAVQRVAAQVVKAEMELLACQHIAAQARSVDPFYADHADLDVAVAQSILDSEILALRVLGGLEGIETEDGAVLRAWLIVSDTIATSKAGE